MIEKCDAFCDAWKAPVPHLWLRKNIFYCRIEKAKNNGKRRYFRISLHTSNYYEAMERIKTFMNINAQFNELVNLYNKIKFIRISHIKTPSPGHYGPCSQYYTNEIEQDTDPQLIKEVVKKLSTLEKIVSLLSENQQKILKEITDKHSLFEAYLKQHHIEPTLPKALTLQEVLDKMLFKANNKIDERTRKTNFIKKAIKQVNLTLDDDYSKFHNIDIIKTISDWIINALNIKGTGKNEYLRYIKDFVKTACIIEPNYNPNILEIMPKVKKTKKNDTKPHLPYKEDELKEIFNINNNFFKDEPDMFWICLIALFTGARHNAATTLQYGDIITEESIPCIYFRSNNEIKKLKNEASERKVPIHNTLIDLGFLDYINRKKLQLKATDEDFIFPKCKTKTGNFNSRYILRTFTDYITKLGIKKENNDGHDFHSFRKNASIALQDTGIIPSYINNIIGWEGKSVMEQSYSNHTIKEINTQLNKLTYNWLIPLIPTWKKVMASIKFKK